jgi:hypothetical protein
MKVPQHIAKEIFSRTVRAVEQVRTSNLFLYRGHCPICNDLKKKRMYLKEYPEHYLVYCHNCGYSHKFEVFLKNNYPSEYVKLKPYIFESIKNGSFARRRESVKFEPVKRLLTDEDINRKLTTYLPMVSFNIMDEQLDTRREKYRALCLKYLIDRRIPEAVFRDFYCIYARSLAGYIGIPFFDKTKKNLLHVQGRLVLPRKNPGYEQQKYLFLKDSDMGVELESKQLWGMWRIQSDKPVIICEGTLDACAFENGVATCGATLSETFIRNIIKQYKNRIWCVDNYFLDKAGRDLTQRLLEMGESCFVIPRNMIDKKDANDLIKDTFKEYTYIPESFIQENTYVGGVNGGMGLSKLRILT